MSLSLSADSTWLLVNLSNSEIHLWDVIKLIEKMEEEERAAIPGGSVPIFARRGSSKIPSRCRRR